MIIESACFNSINKLIRKEDCTEFREEELSYILASSSESILRGLGFPNYPEMVQVEVPYLSGGMRCDLVLKSKMYPYAIPQLTSHDTFIECKYFRQNNAKGNKTNRVKSLWSDFRKVVSNGAGFSYSVVLIENKYNTVLPQRGKHKIIVEKCFALKSNSKFSLWSKTSSFPKGDDVFSLQKEANNTVEIEIMRNYTEPFPLKFTNNNMRLFRIYIFRLYSKTKNSRGFEF